MLQLAKTLNGPVSAGAYDPTVGFSSQLSPLEEGAEDTGYMGVTRKFTLEDTGMEGSSSDTLGRDSGRRRVNRNRGTADGDADTSPGTQETRGLLDESRHLV